MQEIIYISDIPWRDITQRQHHLCNNLANYSNVIYFSCNSFTQVKKYLKKNYQEPFSRNQNLNCVELFLLPFTRFWLIRQINFYIAYCFLFLHLIIKRKKTEIILSHPSQSIFLGLPAISFYFDYVDDASAFQIVKNNADVLKNNENLILSRSKCVFAPSKRIADLLIKDGNKVYLVPNSVNIEDFSKTSGITPPDLLNVKAPVVGFYGAINEVVDLELIKYLALSNPDINFFFIGPVFEDITSLKEIKNVTFTGEKPYSILPDYLSEIEVWLIPFKQSSFLEKVNPVKVYEYLAANRTIITTYLPEIIFLKDYLFITNTKEEFQEKLRIAIQKPLAKNSPEKIREILKNNTWQAAAEKMAKAILEH